MSTYRGTFEVDAQGPASPSGSLKYYDSLTRLTMAATSITSVAVNGTAVTIEGAATMNAVGGYTSRLKPMPARPRNSASSSSAPPTGQSFTRRR
jgi:hypothetical protein